MRRLAAPLCALVLLAGAPARAADKLQSSLVNPGTAGGNALPALTGPVSTAWINGRSKGSTTADDKCRIDVRASRLDTSVLPDSDGVAGTGDEVICLGYSNLALGYVTPIRTTAVMRGEVTGGKMNIRVNLFFEAVGCTPSGKGPPNPLASFDGRIDCYEPDPSYPPPPVTFASDPTQGIYPSAFAPRPASALIMTQGLFVD